MRSVRGFLRGSAGTWRRLLRELSGFGLVGGFCLVLDLALFQLLYARAGVDPVAAKAVATLLTAGVAFAGHRGITYGHRPRTRLRRGFLLFGLINGTTLLLGLAIIGFVRHGLGQVDPLTLQAANIGAIAAGTAVRFVAYRRWVFREPVLQG